MKKLSFFSIPRNNTPNLHTLFNKHLETKGLKTFTETQKSHRQGRAIVRPCLF